MDIQYAVFYEWKNEYIYMYGIAEMNWMNELGEMNDASLIAELLACGFCPVCPILPLYNSM